MDSIAERNPAQRVGSAGCPGAHAERLGRGRRTYVRRQPEHSVLRAVVRDHLETFLADARARGGGSGVPVLYADYPLDLAADPGEQRPNGPGTDGQLSGLRAALDALEVALLARAAEPESAPVDPATREKLRALGYNF